MEELLTMLRESEHIEEQGDILQYLIDTKGQNYDTGKHIGIFIYVDNLVLDYSVNIVTPSRYDRTR